MKKLFLTLVVVLTTTICAQAQLKVLSNGKVQMSFLDIVAGGTVLGFDPTNNHTVIGSSLDKVDFWYPNVNFNKLVAESYSIGSDVRLKTNILPLKDALRTVNAVKTYSYNLVEDMDKKEQRIHYGILAQELKEILPELVDTSHGYFVVNVSELVPLLINAVQDLSSEVASLKKQLSGKGETLANKSGNVETSEPRPAQQELMLQQNVPNPFSSATNIQGYIPQEIGKAQLCIYNMQGMQVKCITVADRGDVTITVAAGQLTAGVYTYILIGDGKTSDAKQMILTK